MGWLSVALCAIPTFILWKNDSVVLAVLAGLNLLVNFWSFGVMHNYAVSASASTIKELRQDLAIERRLDAERQAAIDSLRLRSDPQAVPNWLATINMATSLVGLVGLVFALVT